MTANQMPDPKSRRSMRRAAAQARLAAVASGTPRCPDGHPCPGERCDRCGQTRAPSPEEVARREKAAAAERAARTPPPARRPAPTRWRTPTTPAASVTFDDACPVCDRERKPRQVFRATAAGVWLRFHCPRDRETWVTFFAASATDVERLQARLAEKERR